MKKSELKILIKEILQEVTSSRVSLELIGKSDVAFEFWILYQNKRVGKIFIGLYTDTNTWHISGINVWEMMGIGLGRETVVLAANTIGKRIYSGWTQTPRAKKMWQSISQGKEKMYGKEFDFINPAVINEGLLGGASGGSGTGYSQAPEFSPDTVTMERDPLNDPKLTGKKPFKEGTFKFKDFDWMKRGDGFGMPIDVYYGTILIGVISTEPDYYEVALIKGATKNDDVSIKKDERNRFKTKESAAEAVHLMWKLQRSPSPEEIK